MHDAVVEACGELGPNVSYVEDIRVQDFNHSPVMQGLPQNKHVAMAVQQVQHESDHNPFTLWFAKTKTKGDGITNWPYQNLV